MSSKTVKFNSNVFNSNAPYINLKMRDEIYFIFFIILILSFIKDESIMTYIQNNHILQLVVVFLFLYSIYHKIPIYLLFSILFIIAISTTNIICYSFDVICIIIQKFKSLNFNKLYSNSLAPNSNILNSETDNKISDDSDSEVCSVIGELNIDNLISDNLNSDNLNSDNLNSDNLNSDNLNDNKSESDNTNLDSKQNNNIQNNNIQTNKLENIQSVKLEKNSKSVESTDADYETDGDTICDGDIEVSKNDLLQFIKSV